MELTNEEKQFLSQNRLASFRVYHVRTLATVLQLLKQKKGKDAVEYLESEIYSVTKINNNEFAKLIDALTLQLQLKEKNDKNNSSAR